MTWLTSFLCWIGIACSTPFGAFQPISIPAGGTGTTTVPTYGKVLIGNGTGYDLRATSTLGMITDLTTSVTGVLGVSNGGTGINSYVAGDLLYADGANHLSNLGIGTNNDVLTVSGGFPAWVTPSAGTPGGSNTQIQFNNGGVFGGAAGLLWHSASKSFSFESGENQPIYQWTGAAYTDFTTLFAATTTSVVGLTTSSGVAHTSLSFSTSTGDTIEYEGYDSNGKGWDLFSGGGEAYLGLYGATRSMFLCTDCTTDIQTSSSHLGFSSGASTNEILFDTSSNLTANRTLSFADKSGVPQLLDSTGLGLTKTDSASTTRLSCYGPCYFGATATTTITSTGAVGVGTSTPSTIFQIFSIATSTGSIDSNSSSKGGCLEVKDFDGTGYTYITVNNGILYSSTVSCK